MKTPPSSRLRLLSVFCLAAGPRRTAVVQHRTGVRTGLRPASRARPRVRQHTISPTPAGEQMPKRKAEVCAIAIALALAGVAAGCGPSAWARHPSLADLSADSIRNTVGGEGVPDEAVALAREAFDAELEQLTHTRSGEAWELSDNREVTYRQLRDGARRRLQHSFATAAQLASLKNAMRRTEAILDELLSDPDWRSHHLFMLPGDSHEAFERSAFLNTTTCRTFSVGEPVQLPFVTERSFQGTVIAAVWPEPTIDADSYLVQESRAEDMTRAQDEAVFTAIECANRDSGTYTLDFDSNGFGARSDDEFDQVVRGFFDGTRCYSPHHRQAAIEVLEDPWTGWTMNFATPFRARDNPGYFSIAIRAPAAAASLQNARGEVWAIRLGSEAGLMTFVRPDPTRYHRIDVRDGRYVLRFTADIPDPFRAGVLRSSGCLRQAGHAYIDFAIEAHRRRAAVFQTLYAALESATDCDQALFAAGTEGRSWPATGVAPEAFVAVARRCLRRTETIAAATQGSPSGSLRARIGASTLERLRAARPLIETTLPLAQSAIAAMRSAREAEQRAAEVARAAREASIADEEARDAAAARAARGAARDAARAECMTACGRRSDAATCARICDRSR